MNISKQHNIISLGERKEITSILDSGKKIKTKFGLIFLKRVNKDSITKAAVLLKKSCGSAVKRNYIKRIIRHFIKDQITLFNGYNRVVFLYNYKKEINYNSLKNEYINALKKI
jgi:ribonuclease P protein component